jgi:hypothetical protein
MKWWFKKHTEEVAEITENGMELFKGEVFDMEPVEDMPELNV